MNSFIRIFLTLCILISSCTSIKQSQCERLKKEKVELGRSVEEMLDTTKGIYRLKDCGLDMGDIEILRPFIANMFVSSFNEKKEYTYGDILDFYDKIKDSKEYKKEKEKLLKERDAQNKLPYVEKEKPDYYSKLCDTPAYAAQFSILRGYQQYFDYEQALKCAKEQKKILMVIFGGHSCINNRKLETNILSDETIKKLINDHCIMTSLYCDDRTIGKGGKTLGEENMELEVNKFNMLAQPYVVFLDNSEKVLGQTGYCQKEDFLKILNTAIAANN